MILASIPFGVIGVVLFILTVTPWDLSPGVITIIRCYSATLVVVSIGCVYSVINDQIGFTYALLCLYISHASGNFDII